MTYTHNGYPLLETAINPETLEPDTYYRLEAKRMVSRDRKYWHKYFSLLVEEVYWEKWN